jgi:hypothetical protein
VTPLELLFISYFSSHDRHVFIIDAGLLLLWDPGLLILIFITPCFPATKSALLWVMLLVGTLAGARVEVISSSMHDLMVDLVLYLVVDLVVDLVVVVIIKAGHCSADDTASMEVESGLPCVAISVKLSTSLWIVAGRNNSTTSVWTDSGMYVLPAS